LVHAMITITVGMEPSAASKWGSKNASKHISSKKPATKQAFL
jgi:hypothetical protein